MDTTAPNLTFSETSSMTEGEARAYLEAVRAYATTLYESALRPTGKRLFLDKTPRYYFICDELRRVFPKAKFIFLLRNPLAVLASILETWVKQDWSILRWYQADLLQAPRLIADAIAGSPSPINGERGETAPITVGYEDLVANPTSTVQERPITTRWNARRLSRSSEAPRPGFPSPP